MQAFHRIAVLVLTILGVLASATAPVLASPRIKPLSQAHAHNDYEHKRPLFDALDNGFTSVEADIYLVNGALLVGHDPGDLRPDRTLQSLYLEPLRQRVIDNRGKVHAGRSGLFQLLIDLKNNGATTYTELDRVLRSPRYAFMFSQYISGKIVRNAVDVVVSGDRPRELMSGQKQRFAFYDGRMTSPGDLGPGSDAKLAALVSDNWTKLFTWNGAGQMPAAEKAKLQGIVTKAHKAGQRVRFWATPDTPSPEREAIWRQLVTVGVDHLNTDDLSGLRAFLTRG
ncbi:phosphatidylinositol-specific phospholipase C/glycerophosphodiester phosphodiesterase family protein [Allokutzneria sp. A3M-2-11 16]|uniref:phosphatidylinositol-specific phospholipase C/glycerophosphodiester phosphodiesterase family protein n=1 Tax=Allokutzneria sp. A3M-2-11 16 TaxID=2962043 RepID=UPI0020B6C8E0|nr:phosphatidylinositol-specific phospholipase C/glycerophosphodiester phosphodiesterase family protein [Allokutzneria sp. A3M-2-11 16]MCP3800092.1 phosphatidylinositol-specific phospholipase C/glycerophosphodiester phosphodiesterase family protein [Allokutzneria sp. A3M-2-11 16]